MAENILKHPFYPIIYVRGYAGSQGDVEETVADPYMGFNVGATKIRQNWKGDIERHFFESPLVRLMKDYEYRDVYEAGAVMPQGITIQPRSVFIYRYYDQVSKQLGPGIRPEIEEYAVGLGRLILNIRKRLCDQGTTTPGAFRVHLVAHSMGGLVCRCFLQNRNLRGDDQENLDTARAAVDKVFTYATPHNGIDLRVIGNLPGFFSRNNADNFNRKRMTRYLGLRPGSENVASLNGTFNAERFFCLVGTNHKDYAVAGGAARHAVGPMSDGLVRIANATVWDRANDGRSVVHAPRAFVNRSHSGHFGIVNSEGGYQNLTRFLFGDVRVDGRLEVSELTLPPEVEKARKAKKEIRASYHFEVIVRTRGATWDLHRRTVAEESAIHRKFDEMLKLENTGLKNPRHPHLFSTFLSQREMVKNDRKRPSPSEKKEAGPLGFSIDLRVLVPQYEVDGILWFEDHYEGGYIYHDKINLTVLPPPKNRRSPWKLAIGIDSETPNRADADTITGIEKDGAVEFRIPIVNQVAPGIIAELVLTARKWNTGPRMAGSSR